MIILEATNYLNAYLASDSFLAASGLIIILLLDVKVEQHKQSFAHAFKSILNPATAIFLVISLVLGFGYGIFANYLTIYLQEDLGASSAMIGEYT